jgi:RimJ/RimL family protein N-acetyltransferase
MNDATVELRDTTIDELRRICAMEEGEAGRFIIPQTLDRHRSEFARPDVVYKSIWRGDEFIGFVILVLEADRDSVEFRRIVIVEPGKGHGTIAVNIVGELVRTRLGRKRVWLDVFETNDRARHVYESCGYRPFGRSEHAGRVLLLYEKIV